jgi:hypothetical protein
MTHARTDALVAWLDGELTDRAAAELAGHVAQCMSCAAAADALRETGVLFGTALSSIDAAEPASWRTTAHTAGVLHFPAPAADAEPARRHATDATWRSAGVLRRAAVFLLFATAAASAAVIATRTLLNEEQPADTPALTGAPAAPIVATISVTPVDGRVQVTLTGAGAGTRVHVSLTDATDASVAVEDAVPHVTAERGSVRIELDGERAAVRVVVPSAVRAADISANGAVLVRVRDGVVTPAAAAGAGGIIIGDGRAIDP